LDKTEPLKTESGDSPELIAKKLKIYRIIGEVRARSKARREAQIGSEIMGSMASGLVFNEETYAKAKPLFLAALADFKDPSDNIRETMRAIVRMVLDRFGEDVARNMKPYVVRFIEDVAAKRITLPREHSQVDAREGAEGVAGPEQEGLGGAGKAGPQGTGMTTAQPALRPDPADTRMDAEPTPPTPDQSAADIDEELQKAPGELGEVLSDVFSNKVNVVRGQYTAADLLPLLSTVVSLIVRRGAKRFRSAVLRSMEVMRANEATARFVDSIQPRQWRAAYNAIAEDIEGTDIEEVVAQLGAAEFEKLRARSAIVERLPAPDGMEAVVFSTSDGFGAAMLDTEADEYVDGTVRRFTGEGSRDQARAAAQEMARKATPNGETPHAPAATPPEAPAQGVESQAKPSLATAVVRQAVALAGETIELGMTRTAQEIVTTGRQQGRSDAVNDDRLVWAPPGTSAALTGVEVPKGTKLDKMAWLEALAERVTRLLLAEDDRKVAMRESARMLETPDFADPQEAGQFLVEGNWALQTALTLQVSAIRDPFPVTVLVERPARRREYEETDLWLWLELAAAQLSPHSLD
jgi:hypothetical protein